MEKLQPMRVYPPEMIKCPYEILQGHPSLYFRAHDQYELRRHLSLC